jgi:hypothetical protein
MLGGLGRSSRSEVAWDEKYAEKLLGGGGGSGAGDGSGSGSGRVILSKPTTIVEKKGSLASDPVFAHMFDTVHK